MWSITSNRCRPICRGFGRLIFPQVVKLIIQSGGRLLRYAHLNGFAWQRCLSCKSTASFFYSKYKGRHRKGLFLTLLTQNTAKGANIVPRRAKKIHTPAAVLLEWVHSISINIITQQYSTMISVVVKNNAFVWFVVFDVLYIFTSWVPLWAWTNWPIQKKKNYTAWIKYYIPWLLWNRMTYPCPNFSGVLTDIEVRAWMDNYITEWM